MGFYNEGGSGAAATGRLVKTTYLTTGTGATFTPQSETTQMIVTVVGGGGGGGGVAETAISAQVCGGCGGGGGYAVKRFTDMSDTFTYSIGTGGPGGTAGANSGSAGGTSTFSASPSGITVTANGGGGGIGVSVNTSSSSSGGRGGSSNGGDINLDGSDGTTAYVRSSLSYSIPSSGASPFFGGSQTAFTLVPPGDATSSDGKDGNNYGSGGTGGRRISQDNTGTNYAGGNGANGIIIVEEYS